MSTTRDKVDQLEAELRRFDSYEEHGETPPSHHFFPAMTWRKKVSIGIWSILNFLWLAFLICVRPGFITITKDESKECIISTRKLLVWWVIFALFSAIGIYIYRHRRS